MEAMSNTPTDLENSTLKESFYVDFISILCQKAFQNLQLFLNMGLTPLPPPFQQCPRELQNWSAVASLIEFPPKFHLKVQKRPIPKDPLKTASQNH